MLCFVVAAVAADADADAAAAVARTGPAVRWAAPMPEHIYGYSMHNWRQP